jgi:hypothetical protein
MFADALSTSPSTFELLVLVVHLLATAAMTGLIWFVQVVHYPLFAAVGAERFDSYAQAHQRRTSFVVGPFMAAEGVTALWMALLPPTGVPRWLAVLGLAVLAVVLGSTVLLQVPQHAVLAEGFDSARTTKLVRTNWIRTIGWSTRSIIAGAMLIAAVRT